MKTEQNNVLINKLEEKVENALADAISIFQNLSDKSLLSLSATGGWSIAQCLEHLNSYGNFYLPEIKLALEKAKKAQSHPSFSSGWLGKYFTSMMDPKSGKKFKAFKDHIPSLDLNAPKVVAEFIHQQEVLLEYLRQGRELDLNSVRVPISITRWVKLKLGDVFQFLVAHNERHLLQAKGNLAPPK